MNLTPRHDPSVTRLDCPIRVRSDSYINPGKIDESDSWAISSMAWVSIWISSREKTAGSMMHARTLAHQKLLLSAYRKKGKNKIKMWGLLVPRNFSNNPPAVPWMTLVKLIILWDPRKSTSHPATCPGGTGLSDQIDRPDSSEGGATLMMAWYPSPSPQLTTHDRHPPPPGTGSNNSRLFPDLIFSSSSFWSPNVFPIPQFNTFVFP